jgi:hypothetical protein
MQEGGGKLPLAQRTWRSRLSFYLKFYWTEKMKRQKRAKRVARAREGMGPMVRSPLRRCGSDGA